ncbi:AIPR family protein [Streptococcus sobrinus]|uniref:Abortive phage infection protein n=2 Tax=Streptococcus sobrinus TaxID=1310 RepID=A0ABM6W2V3_9STRE|nr:AIPR family protein [Streptococcus sobrinus]AWN19915.1 abortive phage infection protein [Streptococcus sobrinus]SQG12616.1 AIPR protein [Streptococcus sobrinus]
MTNIYNFTAKAVRTIPSPSQEGVTTYFAYINFRDLPDNLPLEVNPREPKMTTNVGKTLKEAVESSDTDFDINNRGIVLVAKGFKFDTSKSMITLDLGNDPKEFGILDGGHTYTAIKEKRDALNDDINKYVRLEIIVGENLTVSRIADARNTSANVSDEALLELDDKFDFIKEAVKNESYAKDIAFKDNSPERLRVNELLKLIYIYNVYEFTTANEIPIKAYSSKMAVLKDLKKDLESKKNDYFNLAKLLPELVRLYNTVETEYKNKYLEYSPSGRFGAVRGIEKRKDGKKPFKSLYLEEDMEYKVSVGYILPVFAAFRVLLDKDTLTWKSNPFELWNKIGSELVKNTLESSRNNPQDAGKNTSIWSNNYSKVENALFRELLAGKQ